MCDKQFHYSFFIGIMGTSSKKKIQFYLYFIENVTLSSLVKHPKFQLRDPVSLVSCNKHAVVASFAEYDLADVS
jgi:hypothetical protein